MRGTKLFFPFHTPLACGGVIDFQKFFSGNASVAWYLAQKHWPDGFYVLGVAPGTWYLSKRRLFRPLKLIKA